MALDTIKLKNVGSQASVFVQDLANRTMKHPPYFAFGQAQYFPYDTTVTILRDGYVEESLVKGQLKKLIDHAVFVVVP